MQNEDPNDFYDTSIRNRRFGRVNALNGPQLLEKYGIPTEIESNSNLTDFSFLQTYIYRGWAYENGTVAKFLVEIWYQVDEATIWIGGSPSEQCLTSFDTQRITA